MSLESKLEKLHESLVDQLLARIESGEAAPADLNTARQLLKDHGIVAIPEKNPKMGRLTDVLDKLPFGGRPQLAS